MRLSILLGLIFATPSLPESGSKWLESFAAYPGARELCQQHVLGNNAEIAWRGYVTRDATDKVIAFYVKAEGKEHVEMADGSVTVRHGDKVLSVHSTSSKDYPHCDQSPRADEKTIVIVSQITRR